MEPELLTVHEGDPRPKRDRSFRDSPFQLRKEL